MRVPETKQGRQGRGGRRSADNRVALSVHDRGEAGRARGRQHKVLTHLPTTGARAGDRDRAVRAVIADAGVGQASERELVARAEVGDRVPKGCRRWLAGRPVKSEPRGRGPRHRAESDRPRTGRSRSAELKRARRRAPVRADRRSAGVGAGPGQRLRAAGDRHAASAGNRAAVAGRAIRDGQRLRAERRPAGA